jgi:RNA polymerase sigma factor (sigma-70 family)
MSFTPSRESRDELVQRALRDYEAPLLSYAVSLLGDLDRARDVVQDTFIRLYEQEEGKVNDGLKAWLYTVCRNRAFDVLRRRRRIVEMDDESLAEVREQGPNPSEQLERHETESEVIRFLARLPANQREVIRLKFQGDLSYKQISQVTGLSASNVGFLIHTGLKRLRGLMSHAKSSFER